MFSKRPQYPSPVARHLPSINSEASIHLIDTAAPRSNTRDRRAPSNLSPYIAEIERRKKVRSVLRETNTRSRQAKERQREHSLNKFRIQDCSYYSSNRHDSSLRARPRNDSQHEASSFSNSNINATTTISSTKNTIERRRGLSRKKVLPDELTLEQPSLASIQKDELLKNFYNKLRTKCEQEAAHPEQKKGYRDRKYKVGESDSDTNTQSNLRKIAYTVNNIEKVSKDLAPTEQLRNRNKTIVNINPNEEIIPSEKRNFRKGKYEIQSQIISGSDKQEDTKYSSVDIQKKESNTSLIRELDLQTQKQAEQQDRVISLKIKKILDKSLEKSTEEYFREHSEARNMKSRNQIDIYMSTVKNPSAYRCSQASTLNVSDKKEELYVSTVLDPSRQDLLSYDFNLEQDVGVTKPAKDNAACFLLPEESEEGSVEGVTPLGQFEKERKEAERRFAQHDHVRIDWSDEDLDCTVKAEEI